MSHAPRGASPLLRSPGRLPQSASAGPRVRRPLRPRPRVRRPSPGLDRPVLGASCPGSDLPWGRPCPADPDWPVAGPASRADVRSVTRRENAPVRVAHRRTPRRRASDTLAAGRHATQTRPSQGHALGRHQAGVRGKRRGVPLKRVTFSTPECGERHVETPSAGRGHPQRAPPVSLSRRACRASSEASEPSGTLVDAEPAE